MSLWKALSTPEGVYINNPEGVTKLKVYDCDELFARQLCYALIKAPSIFELSNADLDTFKVPKVIK